MTEAAVLMFMALVAVAVVYAVVARAGRQADRQSSARQRELDALARIHDRRSDG